MIYVDDIVEQKKKDNYKKSLKRLLVKPTFCDRSFLAYCTKHNIDSDKVVWTYKHITHIGQHKVVSGWEHQIYYYEKS